RDKHLSRVSGLMIFGKSDDDSGIKFKYIMDSLALGFVVSNQTINTHAFNTLILQDIENNTTLQAGYYDDLVELPLTDTQTYIIGDYFAGAAIEKLLI